MPLPRGLIADDLVGELIGGTIGVAATRLVRHESGVRAGGEIEDVHQVRVATRRLRADLSTFRRVLDPTWVDQLRADLRWLAALAGPVRDADVLYLRLTTPVDGLPQQEAAAGAELLARLSDERAAYGDVLLAGMSSRRYHLLLDALVAAGAKPPLVLTEGYDSRVYWQRVLARATRNRWRALARAVGADQSSTSIAQLHAIRIRAKRARYTAQTAQQLCASPAGFIADAATAIQGALGELHDAVVAEAWLRTGVQSRSGPAAPARMLMTTERVEIERRRRAWPEVWASASLTAQCGLPELEALRGIG